MREGGREESAGDHEGDRAPHVRLLRESRLPGVCFCSFLSLLAAVGFVLNPDTCSASPLAV